MRETAIRQLNGKRLVKVSMRITRSIANTELGEGNNDIAIDWKEADKKLA